MEESNKMITDSANRLGKAAGELKDLIVRQPFLLAHLDAQSENSTRRRKSRGLLETRNS